MYIFLVGPAVRVGWNRKGYTQAMFKGTANYVNLLLKRRQSIVSNLKVQRRNGVCVVSTRLNYSVLNLEKYVFIFFSKFNFVCISTKQLQRLMNDQSRINCGNCNSHHSVYSVTDDNITRFTHTVPTIPTVTNHTIPSVTTLLSFLDRAVVGISSRTTGPRYAGFHHWFIRVSFL